MDVVSLANYPEAKIIKIEKSTIDKIDFCLCKDPQETLESFCNRQTVKPDIITNGGFFNMSNGGTIFTYKDDGKVISYDVSLVEGMGIKDNQLVFGNYDSSYKDFICAYPVLIKDGKKVTSNVGKELDYKARRTMLAYDDDFVYVICVDSPGLTFAGMKTLLTALKVKYAINLDGGGSTRMLCNGKLQTSSTIGNRPVDNVLCIYLKKPQTEIPSVSKVLYRVQTGAFGVKSNAENLKAKINNLTDSIGAGYKNAYIRYINGLYKVQIGAFSIKENASKVVADLRTKGIDAFITTE